MQSLAEYPHTPLIQYDALNPPYVPEVCTTSEVFSIIPLVCSVIANEATNKADAHAGRMMFYNLCSDKAWNNDYFKNVVQLVIDIITLRMVKKHIRSPEQGISDAVSQGVTSLVSLLFVQYRDLRGMVKPGVLNAAEQNIPSFQNLQQEIASMQNTTPGYGHMTAMSHPHGMNGGHFPQAHGYQHGHAPVHGHQGPAVNQPYQTPQGWFMLTPNGATIPVVHTQQGWVPAQQPQQHIQQHYQHPNVPAGSNYGNHSTFASGHHGHTGGFTPTGNQTVGGRFSGAGSSHSADVQPRQPVRDLRNMHLERTAPAPVKAAPVAVAPKETESKYLEIEGGTEMDRAKHRVGVVGGNYRFSSENRNSNYAEAVEKLCKTRVTSESEDMFVDVNIAAELTADAAIICGQVKQLERQKHDSSVNAFRCFMSVCNPIISTVEVAPYMKRICESEDFDIVAKNMKSIAKAVEVSVEDSVTADAVATFLHQIDIRLTDLVNEFLSDSLLLETNIDSFSEDISDLGEHLFRTKGHLYSDAYRNFETAVMAMLLQEMDEEVQQDLADKANLGESMFVSFMPVNYSLTFVPLTSKELGYKVGNKVVTIDHDVAPSLYWLATSIATHSKQVGDFFTLVNLIVTSDGQRYRVRRNPMRSEEYLINKV
jgi:hypothetical protein